ncbi:MAG: aminoacyl-tRNA hydrolase [Flavobacteriales bacterium]|nr:aminoacyl-tRNA hydrolase [Flavobacteriales bacterium]
MKYLIVGLGNPGIEYQNTRHNIGFKVLDELASSSNVFFKTDRLGEVASFKFKGRSIYLLKPNTFMNLSGKAVNYWLNKLKITNDNLLVVTDDISLELGLLRLKSKGSSGGHNGLKDIEAVLSTAIYPRLRFGVGSNFSRGNQVDFVLGEWDTEELITIKNKTIAAQEIIKSFCTIGIDRTMNTHNNK